MTCQREKCQWWGRFFDVVSQDRIEGCGMVPREQWELKEEEK